MLKCSMYKDIVGEKVIQKIEDEVQPLIGKHIIHVNSTYYGGGVAEMLNSLVPLMNNIGINTGWRLLKGNPDFFTITKKFHNSLQGEKIHMTNIKKKIYEQVNESNSFFSHIGHHDCIIVHDPQPLPLINYYRKNQPWIWRVHIDLSKPNVQTWNYLKNFVKKYDRIIVSKKTFKRKIDVPQSIIYPSIDPLNHKNEDLSDRRIQKTLQKFGIEQDKPIMCQISRFDKWKDPLGVIRTFKLVRKKFNCKLVLLGSSATDDPEGQIVYDQVMKAVKDEKDIHVINYTNNHLVNSLQRASDVIVQKSLREGFGLTVTEALWKSTPVVASNVGGIHLQIKNGYNGYLVDSVKSCAKAVEKVLKNPKKAKVMGKRGKEYIRENFLVTRHLRDYIKLMKDQIIHYKTNKVKR